MKPDAYRQLSDYRIREGKMASDDDNGNNGAFLIPCGGVILSVVVSDGMDWDHVSVSMPNRCPMWEQMCYVKDLFFEPHEVVMQLHPAKSEYVNYHPHCLHLWRPQNRRIPTPSSWMVGPKMEPSHAPREP